MCTYYKSKLTYIRVRLFYIKKSRDTRIHHHHHQKVGEILSFQLLLILCLKLELVAAFNEQKLKVITKSCDK